MDLSVLVDTKESAIGTVENACQLQVKNVQRERGGRGGVGDLDIVNCRCSGGGEVVGELGRPEGSGCGSGVISSDGYELTSSLVERGEGLEASGRDGGFGEKLN